MSTTSELGFNTQPPEGGWLAEIAESGKTILVSTHSRLKAAGIKACFCCIALICFNTQPPEGGWGLPTTALIWWFCFNTQPPEGGWGPPRQNALVHVYVSTHSRLKAAGERVEQIVEDYKFQHTAA